MLSAVAFVTPKAIVQSRESERMNFMCMRFGKTWISDGSTLISLALRWESRFGNGRFSAAASSSKPLDFNCVTDDVIALFVFQ